MDTGNTGAADTEREQFTRDLYRVCKPAITAAINRRAADRQQRLGVEGSIADDAYDDTLVQMVFIDLIGQAYDVFAGSMQGMMLMPAIRAGIQAKLNDLDKQEGQV